VKALLVPKAKEPSRQAVASRVAKLDGTRLAGFHLTSNKDDENKGYWTPVHYRLEASKSAQTADATSVDVITEADIREYTSKPAARPADAGGMPFVITEATKEQLRVQGRSHEEIANLTPQKAREILLAALATVLAEWGKTIGVGATRSLDHVIKIAADHPSLKAALVVVAPTDGAETISNVRLERWLRDYNEVPINGLQLSGGGVDETGSPLWTLQSLPSKPLHGKDLPLGDEAPASEPEPEPEATGGSSEEDDADGWQFNREPDAVRPEPAAPEAPPDAFNAEGRLAVWRNAFAPLNFETEPCPGWRPGEWPRAYACCKQFLAGSWALAAARAGWSALDLFAVHMVVGVAARDCVGALSGNTTNGFAVRVEADGALQFANGTKVRKRPLDSNLCIPIWSFRAPTTAPR